MRVTKRLTPQEVKKIIVAHLIAEGEDLTGKQIQWDALMSHGIHDAQMHFSVTWDEEVVVGEVKAPSTKVGAGYG